MRKKALASLALSVLFVTVLLGIPQATADVYVPPGPGWSMSEWISPTLVVLDMQDGLPIGWMYSDSCMYDSAGYWTSPQSWIPKIEKSGPWAPFGIERTVIPFSTEVAIVGWIPGVSVSPDQVPPPVVLVITWNGVPYTVTLDLSKHPFEGKPRVVGMQYPPKIYPDIEDVYPFSYPYNPEAPFKTVYWNVWVGDGNILFGIPESYEDLPQGYYFYYIFHPNVGDWIAFNCEGETKHPPTYDVTALFEYSTVQIWFWHVCFDVRFLEIHKEIKPDSVLEPTKEYLVPIADSWVGDDYPTSNFGGDTQLHARCDSSETRRSYLKFDLSGIDPDLVVDARLWMYCTADYGYNFIDLHATTDIWDEYSITWNNKPAFSPSYIASCFVDGSGNQYYWSSSALTDYIRAEAAFDNTLSLVVKIWPEDTSKPPTEHKDFYSREGLYPPYLEILLRAPYDGTPIPITDTIIIKNVGKVPATELKVWETFPIEEKKCVNHKWNDATISITGYRSISVQMPADWGDYWPYVLPSDYSPAHYDFSTLYPGETMVITTPATVTIPTLDWGGSFVFDLMVMAHEIPPWKYPRSMDALIIGIPTEEPQPLFVGYKLKEIEAGWCSFGLVEEWWVPGPINRNPLPPQEAFTVEMPLDPVPVDLNGDGVINAADVKQVELAIVGLVPYDVAMDINANGKIDAYDLACYELAAA